MNRPTNTSINVLQIAEVIQMFTNSLFDFELTSVALAKCCSWVSRRLIGCSAFKCVVAAVSHLLTFRSVLGSLMTAAISVSCHRAATSHAAEHMARAVVSALTRGKEVLIQPVLLWSALWARSSVSAITSPTLPFSPFSYQDQVTDP